LDSVVGLNGKAGVLLYEAQGHPFLQGNEIAYTHAQPAGAWAPASLPWAPRSTRAENLLLANEFTGALAFGGLIQLGNNQIECSPLDLVHEKYQGVLGAFQGLGGKRVQL
jgi:hypothetical protein